jgi:hypothetical protein
MRLFSIQDAMPFGKHKGKQMQEVIDDDPRYVSWAINKTGFRLDEDAKKYFEEILREHSLGKARSLYSLKIRSILGGK